MAIDYSHLPLSKGTPKADLKAQRDKLREKVDEAENKKVKARSGGQCEIWWEMKVTAVRCDNRAAHVHHMISGWGRRARGKSVLAEHKQHACALCHDLITSHRLRRLGGDEPHYSDIYVRAK